MFETENLQWLLEQYNEDFGTKGNLNLLVKLDEHLDGGVDVVIYNMSQTVLVDGKEFTCEYQLVNDTELNMWCFDNGLDEELFEIERITLIKNR